MTEKVIRASVVAIWYSIFWAEKKWRNKGLPLDEASRTEPNRAEPNFKLVNDMPLFHCYKVNFFRPSPGRRFWCRPPPATVRPRGDAPWCRTVFIHISTMGVYAIGLTWRGYWLKRCLNKRLRNPEDFFANGLNRSKTPYLPIAYWFECASRMQLYNIGLTPPALSSRKLVVIVILLRGLIVILFWGFIVILVFVWGLIVLLLWGLIVVLLQIITKLILV